MLGFVQLQKMPESRLTALAVKITPDSQSQTGHQWIIYSWPHREADPVWDPTHRSACGSCGAQALGSQAEETGINLLTTRDTVFCSQRVLLYFPFLGKYIRK